MAESRNPRPMLGENLLLMPQLLMAQLRPPPAASARRVDTRMVPSSKKPLVLLICRAADQNRHGFGSVGEVSWLEMVQGCARR